MKRKMFYQFASPSIIMMVTLTIFPLVIAVWLGFNFVTYRNLDAPQFVGLENYWSVLSDPRFLQAFRFTLLIIAIVTPVEMFIGFVVALLLDQVAKRIRGLYLALYLLPYLIIPVVGALMFRQLFEPVGLATWFIQEVIGQRFIFSEFSVKALIMTYAIWCDTPFVIIIVFAGLQTLSQELLEAAAIDGASRWQQIRHITIPHLKSLLVLIAMIMIMTRYCIFDPVFVLSEMNPIYKADSLMTYTFRVAMSVRRLGKANAMAVLTVIGIMVVLIPFLYHTYGRQREER